MFLFDQNSMIPVTCSLMQPVCVGGSHQYIDVMNLVEYKYFFLIFCLGFSLFVFSVSNMAESVGEGGGSWGGGEVLH